MPRNVISEVRIARATCTLSLGLLLCPRLSSVSMNQLPAVEKFLEILMRGPLRGSTSQALAARCRDLEAPESSRGA